MVFHIPKADRKIIRKHTPWIVSPVSQEGLSEVPTASSDQNYNPKSEPPSHQTQDSDNTARSSESVTLKSHPKANAIELFYDLFFVANLTTFTNNHEITNNPHLRSYLGFFTLLWFTWLQNSLYDVRFSFDSVFDRVCKAIALSVMTGFAIVSSQFLPVYINSPDPAFDTSSAFRALALILMVSRLTIMAQYGVVLWYIRGFSHSRLPVLLSMAVSFIAAIVFLGTYWDFPDNGKGHDGSTGVAWYVTVVVEGLAMVTIAAHWGEIGFKKTDLIERVGLLSLIIMGEGVIGMTKSVGTILNNTRNISSQTCGTVAAAVLLIYFVWVLYFDQIDDHRFGVLRQSYWAILHFPLHVAILLTLEGSTQLITWNQAQQQFKWLDNHISLNTTLWPSAAVYAKSLAENLIIFNERFRQEDVLSSYNYTLNLTHILRQDFETSAGVAAAESIIITLTLGLVTVVASKYDIVVPESNGTSFESSFHTALEVVTQYNTVYLYYLIAAGMLLVCLGIMYLLGTKHKSKMEYGAVALRLLGGTGLCLLSITNVNPHVKTELIRSPWMIPLVVLVFFAVIVLDHFLMWAWARKRFGKDEMQQVEES